MRQYDVFANPSARSREIAPFVVTLQSHLLSALPTVVVAPLLRNDARSAYSYTSVRVVHDGQTYILSVAEAVAMDIRNLQQAVGNLLVYEDAIRSAISRVFNGF